ncbi:AMP-binding protein [Corynebacterium lactis]|uniref:AMP-dependent synthetase n=1 Tax=Corynebacterium lactis RW2-5 TaxID=1408189 RepID=A0A0K2GYM8_9CORY|nr:AMP-binding protein [Corynebacterium lactis]ALA66890.1 AMP-dependent synthetase [Corynebacterium lactis RW2-5]
MPLTSNLPSLEIPDYSLFDLLFGELDERHENKLAIVDSGSQATFRELKSDIEAFAGALAHRGIKQGDVVALHCPNSTTFAVALHGILRAGATCTTVASLATAEDVEKQIKASGATMMLTTSSIGWAGARGAESAGLPPERIIGLTGLHGMGEMLAEGHTAPDVDVLGDDIAVIPFSSGTTGVPKGVQLTHRNLIANVLQAGAATEEALREDTPAVTVLPFFHIYGLTALLNLCLYRRATQYTMAKFDLLDFLGIIQEHRAKFAFIAPPIAVGLAKHPAVDNYDLSSLETIFSGAASLQLDLASQVEKRLDCVMAQGYGMTESSPAAHIRIGHDSPLDSIGRAVPNTEYKIVDVETEQLLEIDPPREGRSEPGELWIRGPQVMVGYLNNPEATAATLVDGWLRTGDIAELDSHGNVYIVDRFKELIKYKGYQVPPAELESVLLGHPDIADAACSGVIRQSDGEEIPKAYVVVQEGKSLTADEVMEFVAERVAPYKKVRAVEFMDAIPKSATGKILRKDLKAMEAARG